MAESSTLLEPRPLQISKSGLNVRILYPFGTETVTKIKMWSKYMNPLPSRNRDLYLTHNLNLTKYHNLAYMAESTTSRNRDPLPQHTI